MYALIKLIIKCRLKCGWVNFVVLVNRNIMPVFNDGIANVALFLIFKLLLA